MQGSSMRKVGIDFIINYLKTSNSSHVKGGLVLANPRLSNGNVDC